MSLRVQLLIRKSVYVSTR